jgi:hypothetical protein
LESLSAIVGIRNPRAARASPEDEGLQRLVDDLARQIAELEAEQIKLCDRVVNDMPRSTRGPHTGRRLCDLLGGGGVPDAGGPIN